MLHTISRGVWISPGSCQAEGMTMVLYSLCGPLPYVQKHAIQAINTMHDMLYSL